MEYMRRRQQTSMPLYMFVNHRINISQQLFDVSDENKKYMRTSIDQLVELNLELETATIELQEYVNTWNPSALKIQGLPSSKNHNNQNYNYWIQSIRPDYTVDIDDDTQHRLVKKWVEQYSNILIKIDKLHHRIASKTANVKKSYEIQKKIIEPVRNSHYAIGEINLDQINGSITSSQFEIIKTQMQSLSHNSIHSAILLLMTSDDIIRVFSSPRLNLQSFVKQVRLCIEQKEPFGNIASDTIIYNKQIIYDCINEVKEKHRIYDTDIGVIMSANQDLNIRSFDKMIAEFEQLSKDINLEEKRFGNVRQKQYAKLEETSEVLPSRSRRTFYEFSPRRSRHTFYEFSPDIKEDIDNEILTGIIVMTAECISSLETIGAISGVVKAQLHSVFEHSLSILDSFCSNVGRVCSSYVTSAKDIIASLATPIADNGGGGGGGADDHIFTPIVRRARPIKTGIVEKNPGARSYKGISVPSPSIYMPPPPPPPPPVRPNYDFHTPVLEPRGSLALENMRRAREAKMREAEEEQLRREAEEAKKFVWPKEKLDDYNGGKTCRHYKSQKLISRRKKYSRRK